VLIGLKVSRCFVCLHDIVVYTKSLAERDNKLRRLFDRVRRRNLKLKPEQCEFVRKEICYLGHVILEKGVLTEAVNMEAI
jgi:hypothetical protein